MDTIIVLILILVLFTPIALTLIIPMIKLSKYKKFHAVKGVIHMNKLKKRTREMFFIDIPLFDTLFNNYRKALYARRMYVDVKRKYYARHAYFKIEDQYFSNPLEDQQGKFTKYDEEYKLYNDNFKLYYKLVSDQSLSVDEVLFNAKRPSQRAGELYFFILNALYKGDVTLFLTLYDEYQANVKNRYESLILNERMDTFILLGKEYSIATDIVDLFYKFYSKNEYIEKEIEEYIPANNIEKMVFKNVLIHYYSHTEQHALIETLNEEY